jgi:hypothetical protein
MPRDWEAWLATASGPASLTEEQDRDKTEGRIRDAVEATDLSPNVRIYAKGSYANNTNVRRDADVDVAVEWTNTFKVGRVGDAVGMSPEDLGYTPVEAPITPEAFRHDVEQALIDAFGSTQVETSPDKCVGVKAGTGTLDADVVPCFEFHRYHGPGHYYTGHRIFPKRGGSTANFPKQNYDNGVAKNTRTGKRYKEIGRCMKRLEGELYREGAIPRDYPGYLIESLVYNVPDSFFGHDRRYDDMREVLAFLWNGLKDESVSRDWTEPSALLWLFRLRPDRIPANALRLVQAAWKKMELK